MTGRIRLGRFLEDVYATYGTTRHLASDPLAEVVPFAAAADREVVAFIAAGLSFGRVASIRRAIQQAVRPLGPRPSEALPSLTRREASRLTAGFRYRWIGDRDLAEVFMMLGRVLRDRGGLEPLFAEGMVGSPVDVRPGATRLVEGLTEAMAPRARGWRGARYFLPSPRGPGAAKRLHMFLRWMVRPSGKDVDLGLWASASPAQLIMPLDTHVARISRYIGLTDRKTAGLAMALEITAGLRRVDPDDPVRFDFALSRLGILGACRGRRHRTLCAACALSPACRL